MVGVVLILRVRIAPENKEEMESSLEARFSCFRVNELCDYEEATEPITNGLPLELMPFWWTMVA